MAENDNPFKELPASLVQEVLDRTESISQELLNTFNDLKENKQTWREQLQISGLVKHESDLPQIQTPTSCGIDGAFAIERLLSIDLIAGGAVAVEGLTPPSENRFWPEPKHFVYVDTEAHHPDTNSILRGVMMGMELQLAINAPHDVVFLDGSLTTPTIFFNQALSKLQAASGLKVSEHLQKNVVAYLEAYNEVLLASRTDRYWIAMPKYTTRREIGERLNWSVAYDDRGILSSVLEPGQYTAPLPIKEPDSAWHITTNWLDNQYKNKATELVQNTTNLLDGVRIVYYRPKSWLPALRLEMSQAIALNPARLATTLSAVKHQCASAAMMEPYPLYMADRMVKHLSKAVPAFRQITSQHLSENYEGNIDDVFTNLHGYRTESGR
jgi:hypothetical protein